MLGAPQSPCWPRGFPLDALQQQQQHQLEKVGDVEKFAVLQSLADVQPDVDAMFRLTHKTPFVFDKGKMCNKM